MSGQDVGERNKYGEEVRQRSLVPRCRRRRGLDCHLAEALVHRRLMRFWMGGHVLGL